MVDNGKEGVMSYRVSIVYFWVVFVLFYIFWKLFMGIDFVIMGLWLVDVDSVIVEKVWIIIVLYRRKLNNINYVLEVNFFFYRLSCGDWFGIV